MRAPSAALLAWRRFVLETILILVLIGSALWGSMNGRSPSQIAAIVGTAAAVLRLLK
jgi:hypothetical protein